MNDLPSWLSAFSAVVTTALAGYAAFVGLKTYSHQTTSYDVNLATGIFSEINRYWDRIVDGKGDDVYNYGQILAQFEIAASLFNDDILTQQADKILADHII